MKNLNRASFFYLTFFVGCLFLLSIFVNHDIVERTFAAKDAPSAVEGEAGQMQKPTQEVPPALKINKTDLIRQLKRKPEIQRSGKHEGETCHSSGGNVKFGSGEESCGGDCKVGDTEGTCTCSCICTYTCVGYTDSQNPGQYKGTCDVDASKPCTFKPKSGISGGGVGAPQTQTVY